MKQMKETDLKRKKILFLIHDLGQGGAEKVLVNLVNHMDKTKFEITVMTLFDTGENRQFLSTEITYKYCFSKMVRGNSHLMKFLSPAQLHKLLIKDKYDIEVAYLEGPCARIISGCPDVKTKLVSWIHCEQKTRKKASCSFRNYKEAERCYNRYNQIVCVSETVRKDFNSIFSINVANSVLYNTNDTEKIIEKSKENIDESIFKSEEIKVIGVGKLSRNKGFDRLERVVHRLILEGFPIHLYILGEGKNREKLQQYAVDNQLENKITLFGYQINPYKFIARSDLFVCSSYAEGFSTAATEALILGIPVCTVEVAGMKEMLGDNNEYGVITENTEEALYEGIKKLLEKPALLESYREQAKIRGQSFSMEKTVKAVEETLLNLV